MEAVADVVDVDALDEQLDEPTGSDVTIEVDEGTGQFALLIGGKAPTSHKVRLYAGAVELEPPPGGFKKGDRIVLRVEAEVHKRSFTDLRDPKTDQVIGCRDETGLKITGVSLAR